MSKPYQNATTHIIGAGLAGLNAALQLADVGMQVQLYEASPHAGGRCRSYFDKTLGREIDNGNHLITMANHDVLWLMSRLVSQRHFSPPQDTYHFVDLEDHKRWQYKPRALPRGFTIVDFYRLLRLFIASPQCNVGDIFPEGSSFYRLFAEPLCTATLNTHPANASARLFARVLRALMQRGGTDYPIIQTTYGQALIEPMIKAIEHGKGVIHFHKRLTKIESTKDRITELHFGKEVIALKPQDKVVLAVPPDAAASLFDIKVPQNHNRIVNGHFLYDTTNITPELLGVIDSPAQWIFVKDGLISTTTSDAESSTLRGLSQAEMAKILWKDTCQALDLGTPPLPTHRIVTEKKATFAATPENEARRLSPLTPFSNMVLAGDWLQTGLPATIEGAVFSGRRAADWCLQQTHTTLC